MPHSPFFNELPMCNARFLMNFDKHQNFHPIRWLPLLVMMWTLTPVAWAQMEVLPQRVDFPLVSPSRQPLPEGRVMYVSLQGKDDQPGSQDQPWRTLSHAVNQLQAGDTLVLREGTYYEQLTLSLIGREDAPITLRSYPGEQAVISGAIPLFEQQPDEAWKPVAGSSPQLFESTIPLPNLRSVMGRFAQPPYLGLVTHLNQVDILATRETYNRPAVAKGETPADYDPLYLGPGLWYDAPAGKLYARLDSTHLPEPHINYAGPSDPRSIPLTISPFHAVPLRLSGCEYLTLQDLTITAGGYDTVIVEQSSHIRMQRVNILAGTYGLRAGGLTHFDLHDSMILGNCPPWHFRSDNALRARPGTRVRDLARYNTHALLVTDGAQEYSVFALPINDHWHLSHNTFAQAHDGLYLGGINLDFHHNLITEMQDDGIYLSPMYRRIGAERATLRIHQNLFGSCATALAMGGPSPDTDLVLVYRNVFDLRGLVPFSRPTEGKATTLYAGKPIGDHGSPPWPSMYVYHNTFIQQSNARQALMAFDAGMQDDTQRQILNNVFLHLSNLPGYALNMKKGTLRSDGNVFWSPAASNGDQAKFFARFRGTAEFKTSQNSSNSHLADPGWLVNATWPAMVTPAAGSPLVDTGVAIPSDWPDPLRQNDAGPPDVGALPAGAAMFEVGPRE